MAVSLSVSAYMFVRPVWNNSILKAKLLSSKTKLRACVGASSFGHTSVNFLPDAGLLPKETKKIKQRRLVRARHLMEADENIQTTLAPLRQAVKEQAEMVKKLKEKGITGAELTTAVDVLKFRKQALEAKELEFAPSDDISHRIQLEDFLRKRFFYSPSCDIYGGVSGFYDLGPMGCGLKSNLLNIWRKHFILEEQMLEVDSSIFTPESVLKASGHVDRFSDYMVQDLKTGESFRVDHLIKAYFEDQMCEKHVNATTKAIYNDIISKLDTMTKEELADVINKYEIKSPTTGSGLSEVTDFNLMFKMSVAPTGLLNGFLRPETAQGIFVNFKKLLDFNQGQLPFAAAQIGTSFRNEISPRSGLIRAREFSLAEIEHFFDPNCHDHSKINTVENLHLLLYSRVSQTGGKQSEVKTVKEALQQGIFVNQSLAYYIARIQLYLVKVGVDPKRIRFRQHLADELSHYATDCWDAECHTSYGWVECVGCSDRSCYDLTRHSKATGVKLTAERKLNKPKMIEVSEVITNKQLVSEMYGENAKKIVTALNELGGKSIVDIQKEIDETGKFVLIIGRKEWVLPASVVNIKRHEKQLNGEKFIHPSAAQFGLFLLLGMLPVCVTCHVAVLSLWWALGQNQFLVVASSAFEEFVPHVVEPSFGIGRIMYTIFEHTFFTRTDSEQKKYFALPPSVAPVKCAILPLGSNKEFEPFIEELRVNFTKAGLTLKVENTNRSIGRRYTHMDQIGVPYSITVDFDTLSEPHTATLRERNSTVQVRVPLTKLPELVKLLVSGELSWENLQIAFPKFLEQQKSKTASEGRQ